MVKNSATTHLSTKNATANVGITPVNQALAGDIRVLLIEDNAADARLMQEFLMGTVLYQFHLTHVDRLEKGIQHLNDASDNNALNDETYNDETYDVVLLDLTLPDSDGLSSLERLLVQVPRLPIVVLTHMNNPDLAVEAVRRGAQDYLVKRQLSQAVLVRSLRYAIERKQQAETLRAMNEALEARVQARTQELELANQHLRQEINHRQSVQARLVLAQQAGNIGIFDWNIQADQMDWSDELATLYGIEKSAFGGRCRDWLACIHPEYRSEIEQVLLQSMSAGKGLDVEFTISRGDDTRSDDTRWIEVKTDLFKEASGKPIQMLGIHMDVTDKKQLEAQFLQAQRLESLGTLASGIAHDLNNILTPILSVGQLLPLILSDIDKQTSELLKTLDCSAQRGQKLVQQIVSFSRDNRNFHRTLSVGKLLNEVKRIVDQTLPRTIDIQVDIAPDLWLVEGDDTQLHQIFMNLCVNARDAMLEGGNLQVTAKNLRVDESYLQMHSEAELGDYIVVVVSDTGIGIAEKDLPRIFDPFFTTKGASKGTGLGLAAVQSIVKSHGGFLDVHSTVGEGSQFQIWLPAKPASNDTATDSLTLLQGQQEMILIVDDESDICNVLQLSLEMNGYRVLVAQDGLAAIAQVAEHRDQIDCVLIDLMMPDMDGPTAIPLLQRLQPELPIATMTGMIISTESITQLAKLNVQGRLAKPFTTQDLLALLKTILHPESSSN